MIVDTSAIIAVLFEEDGFEGYVDILLRTPNCRMSVASLVEISLVANRRLGPGANKQCDALLLKTEIAIEPVTLEQALIAREAFLNFGKGRHPAGLNFGDCFSYALATATGEPLLFKGDDFSKTDLISAS